MVLAEIKVRQALVNDKVLLNLMSNIRTNKAEYPPIFVGTPQEYFTKAENAPWIRITMIPGDEKIFADNEVALEIPRVQVDCWIPIVKTDSWELISNQIFAVMKRIGFSRYYDRRIQDYDIPELEMITGNFEYAGLPLG